MKSSSLVFLTCALQASFLFSNQQELAPGVYYEHKSSRQPQPLSLHILTVDPTTTKLVLRTGKPYGNAQKISQLARKRQTIAAINGSFFEFATKNRITTYIAEILETCGIYSPEVFPCYALKVKNNWISIGNTPTGILAWDNKEQPLFTTNQTVCTLTLGKEKYTINNLNKAYKSGPILYNSSYGLITPSAKHVTEVIINDNKVVAVVHGQGSTLIPEHGYVYAVKNAPDSIASLIPGTYAYVNQTFKDATFYTVNNTLNTKKYIVGSTPLLIQDGHIVDTLLQYKSSFYQGREPRSAVGLLPNGNWIFIVVDGRQKNSMGLSLLELASYLQAQGCTHALNLDGGSSSTLVIQDKVVNSPSGNILHGPPHERSIANALLIVPKKASSSIS
jgi:uncharacterized protein YigE (DUF2233 family)